MKKVITLLLVLIFGANCFAQVKVEHLLTENLADPISIDALTPRFSWKLEAGGVRGVMQTAYEIRVGIGPLPKNIKHLAWSSGKVKSDESVYVDYKGEPLLSGQRYEWQVRIWDN